MCANEEGQLTLRRSPLKGFKLFVFVKFVFKLLLTLDRTVVGCLRSLFAPKSAIVATAGPPGTHRAPNRRPMMLDLYADATHSGFGFKIVRRRNRGCTSPSSRRRKFAAFSDHRARHAHTGGDTIMDTQVRNHDAMTGAAGINDTSSLALRDRTGP